MRIAIVGTGHIGSTLARHFVDSGYDVVVSNSRGPESLVDLVEELGPHASAATAEEAVRSGDLVVVSVPLKNYRDVPSEGIGDKVVIDTMNYFPDRDGTFAALESGKTGSSEMLAERLGSRPRRQGLQHDRLGSSARRWEAGGIVRSDRAPGVGRRRRGEGGRQAARFRDRFRTRRRRFPRRGGAQATARRTALQRRFVSRRAARGGAQLRDARRRVRGGAVG